MKIIKGLKLAFSDFSEWLLYKRRVPKVGYIYGYVSKKGKPFGSGKTLSMVSKMNALCRKYAGNVVRKKVVHINIFSNLDLKLDLQNDFVHCYRIDNLDYFVKSVEACSKPDQVDNCIFYNYLLLDEIGAEFNSRSFSKNFTPDFLARLVTMRHFNCSCFWTAQNFSLVDKIWRDLTTQLATCSHVWRFYKNTWWIPSELEAKYDKQPGTYKPIRKKRLFAWPEIFQLYDSFAAFEAMKKSQESGNYLTVQELNERYASAGSVLVAAAEEKKKRKGIFKK